MELLVEHDMSPGTIYENKLILGGACSAVLNEMDLHESSGASGTLVKFKGKFQEAEAVNKNKRMYPFDVLDSNVNALNECIKCVAIKVHIKLTLHNELKTTTHSAYPHTVISYQRRPHRHSTMVPHTDLLPLSTTAYNVKQCSTSQSGA